MTCRSISTIDIDRRLSVPAVEENLRAIKTDKCPCIIQLPFRRQMTKRARLRTSLAES